MTLPPDLQLYLDAIWSFRPSHEQMILKKVLTWLKEDQHAASPDEKPVPTWEKICFLLTANNGWEVCGWGITSYGEHQQGLLQEEALMLLHLKGIRAGLRMAGIVFDDIILVYRVYYYRLKDMRFPVSIQDRTLPLILLQRDLREAEEKGLTSVADACRVRIKELTA